MNSMPKTPIQIAAYEAMKAAEQRLRAERTDEAAEAYKAANIAYNETMPAPRGQFIRRFGSSGSRQHKEQMARTQESMLRAALARQWQR